jgi:succinate dehydrogenase / fumarate reductase cytochrome b subunit
MLMSILHRATGVALSVGAFGLAWWLVAVAAGGDSYASLAAIIASPLGQLVLAAFTACLIFHLLNGIRHLLWDIGYGYEIPKVYATGWTVAVLAVVITAGIWFAALRHGGVA